MAEIDTHSKVTTPRLGPAPARMVPAAASSVVDLPTSTTPVPRKLPWIAKRVAIWAAGTTLFACAFHLTGFVLIGMIAIVFPIGYWAKISIEAASVFGPGPMNSHMDDVLNRMRSDGGNNHRLGSTEREFLDRRLLEL